MKKIFKIVFERIEKRRKESDICADFWGKLLRLKENFNEADAWALLIGNIQWVINKKVITTQELMKWFREDKLNAYGIFSKGRHEVKDGVAIAIGNCSIEASGHSKVIVFDSASVEAFDTSFVLCHNTSHATVTDCIATGFDESKIKVKGFGLCEAWDNCNVIAEHKSVVRKHDNAVVSSTVGVTVI